MKKRTRDLKKLIRRIKRELRFDSYGARQAAVLCLRCDDPIGAIREDMRDAMNYISEDDE